MIYFRQCLSIYKRNYLYDVCSIRVVQLYPRLFCTNSTNLVKLRDPIFFNIDNGNMNTMDNNGVETRRSKYHSSDKRFPLCNVNALDTEKQHNKDIQVDKRHHNLCEIMCVTS